MFLARSGRAVVPTREETLDANDDYTLTAKEGPSFYVIIQSRKSPGGARVLWKLQPTPNLWWWPLEETQVPAG